MKYFFTLILTLTGSNLWASEHQRPLKTINIKEKLSTIIEFNQAPSGFILGNKQAFHVERIKKRLVVNVIDKSPQSSNLFVLFGEDKMAFLYLISNPGLKHNDFSKVAFPKKAKPKKKLVKKIKRKKFPWGRISIKILSARFSKKKDYLEIQLKITNGLRHKITPILGYATIGFDKKYVGPDQIRSERKSISSGSSTSVRLLYKRPDLPGDNKVFDLNLPIKELRKTVSTKFRPIFSERRTAR